LFLFDSIFYLVLKIIYEDKQIIGKDTYITIAGCFFPIFGQFGMVFYFLIIIKFLKSYITIMSSERRDRISSRFALLITICWMILPLSFIFGIMPVIGLQHPKHSHMLGMIFLIGIGTNAWLYGMLTSSALRDVLIELNKDINSFQQSSRDLKLVLLRLTIAYYAIIFNAFSVGFVAILFGVYEYLTRRFTFMIILSAFFCSITLTLMILTVSKIPIIKDNNEEGISCWKNQRNSKIIPSNETSTAI
jgi:hypothetical protein